MRSFKAIHTKYDLLTYLNKRVLRFNLSSYSSFLKNEKGVFIKAYLKAAGENCGRY